MNFNSLIIIFLILSFIFNCTESVFFQLKNNAMFETGEINKDLEEDENFEDEKEVKFLSVMEMIPSTFKFKNVWDFIPYTEKSPRKKFFSEIELPPESC